MHTKHAARWFDNGQEFGVAAAARHSKLNTPASEKPACPWVGPAWHKHTGQFFTQEPCHCHYVQWITEQRNGCGRVATDECCREWASELLTLQPWMSLKGSFLPPCWARKTAPSPQPRHCEERRNPTPLCEGQTGSRKFSSVEMFKKCPCSGHVHVQVCNLSIFYGMAEYGKCVCVCACPYVIQPHDDNDCQFSTVKYPHET